MISQFDLDNKIVSKDNKFLYSIIQKNASTSVIAALNTLYYNDSVLGTPYQMLEALEKNNAVCRLCCYSQEDIDSFLDDPHFYKVTTLRDPYERFISAYMTKLVTIPLFMETFGISDDKIINLDNVIEFIDNVPDHERDIHFKSQSLLGNFEQIKYKRVMHVRNLYNNWELLRKDKPGIPKLGPIRNATESSDLIQIINNYHPHAKTKIMDMYKEDYELFRLYGLSV